MENIGNLMCERYRGDRPFSDPNETAEDFKKWYIKTIDDQFKSKKYNEEYGLVIAYTMGALCIVSTSLNYIGDDTYVFVNGKAKKESIEEFADPLVTLAGDCEDLGGKLVTTIGKILKDGNSELKNPSNPWTTKGSWKSDLIQAMQKGMYPIIIEAILGTVSSAKLESKNGGYSPIIINSPEDKESHIGGHMWSSGTSINLLEKYCGKTLNTGVDKDIKFEWGIYIPDVTGEGTGAQFPWVLPLSEYVTSKESKDSIRTFQKKRILASKQLLQKAEFFKYATYEQYPKQLDPKENSSPSEFYKEASSMFPKDLYMNGNQIHEMVLLNTNYDPTYGVHIRYKLYSSLNHGILKNNPMKDSEYQNVGIHIMSKLTEQEEQTLESLLRHIPPQKAPILSEEIIETRTKKLQPIINGFQEKSNSITKNRQVSKDTDRVNFYFKTGEFENEKLRVGLLKDIQNNQNIHNVNAVLEHITDEIYNIRLEVKLNVNMTDTSFDMKEYSHGKKQKTLSSNRISKSEYVAEVFTKKKMIPVDFSKHIDAFKKGILGEKPKNEWNFDELKVYTNAIKAKKYIESEYGEIQKIDLIKKPENNDKFIVIDPFVGESQKLASPSLVIEKDALSFIKKITNDDYICENSKEKEYEKIFLKWRKNIETKYGEISRIDIYDMNQ
jgi:hypothetical protein